MSNPHLQQIKAHVLQHSSRYHSSFADAVSGDVDDNTLLSIVNELKDSHHDTAATAIRGDYYAGEYHKAN